MLGFMIEISCLMCYHLTCNDHTKMINTCSRLYNLSAVHQYQLSQSWSVYARNPGLQVYTSCWSIFGWSAAKGRTPLHFIFFGFRQLLNYFVLELNYSWTVYWTVYWTLPFLGWHGKSAGIFSFWRLYSTCRPGGLCFILN